MPKTHHNIDPMSPNCVRDVITSFNVSLLRDVFKIHERLELGKLATLPAGVRQSLHECGLGWTQ